MTQHFLQILRNVGLCLSFMLLVLLLAEVVGLGSLYYNKRQFADYWHGRNNQPGDFTLVVIGDSASQGVGASNAEHSFVHLLATSIEETTKQSVRVVNLSKSGATVHDALTTQAPQLSNYKPDLVIVEIGANNMRQYDSARDQFAREYEQLLQMVPPGKGIAVDIPVFGGRKNLTRRSEAANQVINKLAKTYNTPVAPLYKTLQEQGNPWIYASDLFHPNDRGYQIWYSAIWPVVEAKLRKT